MKKRQLKSELSFFYLNVPKALFYLEYIKSTSLALTNSLVATR